MAKDSIKGICDSIIDLATALGKEYDRQTTPLIKLICGEWISQQQGMTLTIYERLGYYFMEVTFQAGFRPPYNKITRQISEQKTGMLSVCEVERTISYDKEHDRLFIQYYGEFKRKKVNV